MITTQRAAGYVTGGSAFLVAGAFLLVLHTEAFRGMQEALPAAARIPALQARLSILGEQLEVAKVHAQLRSGSADEKIQHFVLPRELDIDRIVATVELIGTATQKQKTLLHLSPVDIEDSKEFQMGEGRMLTLHPLRFSAKVREEGLRDILAAFDVAGALTIGDLLSSEYREALFQKTEEENPSAILSLEQFLSTELLAYARDPRPYEERLKKSYSSEAFLSTFQGIMRAPLISGAVRLLQGDFGAALEREHLWPLPFLTVDSIDLTEEPDGWYRAEFQILAYSR